MARHRRTAQCGVTPVQVGTPSANPGLRAGGSSALQAAHRGPLCLLLTSTVPDLGPQTDWKSRGTHVARGFWHRGSRLQENVTLGSLDSEGSHCHKAVSSSGHRPAPLVGALEQATPARPPHPLPFMNHTGRLQMSLGSWPQMSLAGDLGSPKGPIQASAGLWKPTQDPGGPARPGDGVGGPPDG